MLVRNWGPRGKRTSKIKGGGMENTFLGLPSEHSSLGAWSELGKKGEHRWGERTVFKIPGKQRYAGRKEDVFFYGGNS